MGLLIKVKGLMSKMFEKNEIKTALGVTPAISDTMLESLELWSAMYAGKAPWIGDGVISLKLEHGIARELANIATLEMATSVSDSHLDSFYSRALQGLATNFATGLATGAMCIKPLPDMSVQYIPQTGFIPIRYNSDGKLVEVVFPETVKDGDTYYTRLEWHNLTPAGLTIINRAFVSHSKNVLGNETLLESRDEWANLSPGIMYKGAERPAYGYFRTPIGNAIDNSFVGVSVYDSAAEIIERADKQFGRLDWEFESGERAVHVDEAALKPKLREDGKRSWALPKLGKRLYRGLNIAKNSGDELFEVFSPAFREASLIAGLEEYKRSIEFTTGLSYGDLSNPSEVAKTAQEIITSKKRKYDTVSAIQQNLRNCLDDLVYALAFYAGRTKAGYDFTCDFKDSILTDEATERAQDERMVSMGVMGLAEFRSKWMGEPLDVAEKNLPANVAVME